MVRRLSEIRRDYEARKRLGRAIVLARTARGLSASDLASRCGLHYSMLSYAENGVRGLSDASFAAVAHVLAIPEAVLLGLATGHVGATRIGKWFKEAV